MFHRHISAFASMLRKRLIAGILCALVMVWLLAAYDHRSLSYGLRRYTYAAHAAVQKQVQPYVRSNSSLRTRNLVFQTAAWSAHVEHALRQHKAYMLRLTATPPGIPLQQEMRLTGHIAIIYSLSEDAGGYDASTGLSKTSLEQLTFFVENGVRGYSRSHHYFIVPSRSADTVKSVLGAALHESNVHILAVGGHDENGTPRSVPQPFLLSILDAFERAPLLSVQYKYLIMIRGTAMVGPFMPVYYVLPWSRALTSIMTTKNDVRLAGCTVSCMSSEGGGRTQDTLAYVQTGVHIIDSTTVELYLTHLRYLRTQQYGRSAELLHLYGDQGMTELYLAAGHNIACLMTPYLGVDFRKTRQCIADEDLISLDSADYAAGHTDPMETVFTTANSHHHSISSAARRLYKHLTDIQSADAVP